MGCADHACKCYQASLEKLAANNTSYKEKGGLTDKMRERLTSAATCAIKMRSKEQDKTKRLALLKRDLMALTIALGIIVTVVQNSIKLLAVHMLMPAVQLQKMKKTLLKVQMTMTASMVSLHFAYVYMHPREIFYL